MSSFLIDIVANALGNIVTWFLLGFVTFRILSHKSQVKFRKFFGLKKGSRVIVYVSNLWDPTRTLTDKPWASIISGQEFQAILSATKLFSTSPFSIPEIVRGLVDAFWIGMRTEIEFVVSPLDDKFDRNNTLVVIGATTKNSVRRAYAKEGVLHVIIDGEPFSSEGIDIHANPLLVNNQFKVIQGRRKDELIGQDGPYELGIVEKVREKNRVVFFCLGSTACGSRESIEYLAQHWKELAEEHGERSFARILWFPKRDICNFSEYLEPVDFLDVH